MALAYYESDDLKQLSVKELVKRYYNIQKIDNLSKRTSIPSQTKEQILFMYDLYEQELQRRVEEEEVEEEEIDDIYERLEEKDNDKSW